MIKHYINVVVRQMRQGVLANITNLLGIALGIACCIVAYINYDYRDSFDKNISKSDNIYRVLSQRKSGEKTLTVGLAPLATSSSDLFTGIDQSCRYNMARNVVDTGEKKLQQLISYTDQSFDEMFKTNLLAGDRTSFSERSKAVLSKESATLLYGDYKSAIGKTFDLSVTSKISRTYEVGAVIDDLPTNCSFKVMVVLNFEEYLSINQTSAESWDKSIDAIFVTTNNVEDLEENINDQYSKLYQDNDTKNASSFSLLTIQEVSDKGNQIFSNHLAANLPSIAVIAPGALAIILLLIAIITYINVSIAKGRKKLKEISVKKTFGVTRTELVFQIFIENFIFSLLATLTGLYLAYILVPAYSDLWSFIQLELVLNTNLIWFLVIVLFSINILGGAYPAYYITSFEPLKILREEVKIKGMNKLVKATLVFQLCLSFVALLSSFVFTNNAAYQKSKDLGYNRKDVIVVPVENKEQYDILYNSLYNLNGIASLAGSRHQINISWDHANILKDDEQNTVNSLEVGGDYIAAMDLSIKEGVDFSEVPKTDFTKVMVVNDQFLKSYELEDPIGSVIKVNEEKRRIVGVVEDFSLAGFWLDISPTVLIPSDSTTNYLIAKVGGGTDISQMDSEIEKLWYTDISDNPYPAVMQEDLVSNAYEINDNIKTMFSFLSLATLIFSCLGLYSVIAIVVANAKKEIGIRKVLGAPNNRIIMLVSKGIMIIMAIALLLGLLAGSQGLPAIVDSLWAFNSGVPFSTILISVVCLILVVCIAVFYQIYLAVKTNPVNVLKND